MKYFLLTIALLATRVTGENTREIVSFKEGSGIRMGPESKESIGLVLAEVEERSASIDIRITAQVYREAREISQNKGEPSGFMYASAWIDPALAEKLPSGTPLSIQGNRSVTGSVVRIDQTMAANGGRTEMLIQIPDAANTWKIGDFVHAAPISTDGSPVTMIPGTALLETAYGPFAFVVNGPYFIRTAIKVGARYGEYIEVTDGLYGGDMVVAQPVEALYLIELRATKGGGHCH